MTILLLVSAAFAVLYGALMFAYRAGWSRQRNAKIEGGRESPRFSIIIPARNESASICALLDSILAQNYPADYFEVIVVDDHSTDATAATVEGYASAAIRLLRLSEDVADGEVINSAKKRALSLGIRHARYTVILTTDADCVVPPTWLQSIAGLYADDDVVLAAAPVDFIQTRGMLYLFQSLDFMAMQGITAAAHAMRLGTMSNGANLSFSRRAFDAVDGYAGIDHLASGDDYLLTLKILKRYGAARSRYLLHQDAVVRTAAQPSWTSFLHQRVRWASKSGKYNDPRLTSILILVYAMNVWLLAIAVVAVFQPRAWLLVGGALACKILLEMFFLWPVATFFGKRRELLAFPFLQPLHILYIVVAGFLGMRGNYRWKGRVVR